MKKIIIICVVALLSQKTLQAQGIVYVSNLGQASTGSRAVGSNSWLAVDFRTGTNSSGYMLNSVQLAMTDASGNASGFTAMIYSSIIGAGIDPGSSLGTLNGSLNPVTAGTYTYNTPSNLILSPSAYYFIVLTAGTAVANGAYEWSVTSVGNNSSYNPSGGWLGGGGPVDQSSDGSQWSSTSLTFAQFAVNATAIPEPGVLSLLGLGGLGFVWQRRKAKAR